MPVTWLVPAALIGLAFIALPIAIHLLVRQQARVLAYPSLRFLRETQLAAFRRRTIQDAALLACRIAIVAAAAAALAGPVLDATARTTAYANRTSRAIVIRGALPAEARSRIEEGAFATTRVQRVRIADALTDAVRWLNAQPRSAREVVIAGALRRGAIDAADLLIVPADIGVRFEQTAADGPGDVPVSILTRRDGKLARVDRVARLTANATGITEGTASPIDADLVSIVARPVDTPLANAALGAALDAGLPWRDFDRRIAIVWNGGDELANGAQLAGAHVIRMPVPAPPSSAADVVLAALTAVGRPEWVEPMIIPQPQLDAWSRRPGAPSLDAPVADEGDRRWLWGLALLLLGVEWWLRGHERTAVKEPPQEARVA